MRSISTIIILLAIATNVKTQSILEVSSSATITVSSGADICADSIIGIIQGEGTICGGVNSIDSGSEKDNPKVFALDQNYPNPFNPGTSIQYAIGGRQFVSLKVYDVLGNEVESLVNEEKPAGNYEVDFNATQLSSGIYFYRLQAGDYNASRKMILIK